MRRDGGAVVSGPPVALAETCRVVSGGIPLWAFHRERLSQGGCRSELIDLVEQALLQAAATHAGERTARLRAHLEVYTDGDYAIEIERRLSSLDVVRGPRLAAVSVRDLPFRASDGGALPPAAAKPADRSWWDAAALLARAKGGHQALILDDDGHVVDGSSASVWIVSDGRVATPLAPPAVAGVARRFVLERLASVGVSVDTRPITLDEVGAADEVFLTNAFGGAVAVRGRGGPVVRVVTDFFREVWRTE